MEDASAGPGAHCPASQITLLKENAVQSPKALLLSAAKRNHTDNSVAGQDGGAAAHSLQPALPSDVAQPSNGQQRKRVLVDMHASTQPAEHIPNEYERQRMERIRRNEAVMQEMGLRQLASGLAGTAQPAAARRTGGAARSARPRSEPAQPTRRSFRTRGSSQDEGDLAQLPTAASDRELREAEGNDLLALEEYFKLEGVDVSGALRTDGHFRGEVAARVAEMYGIQGGTSTEGGARSSGSSNPASAKELKAKGWSGARAWASTQLRTNPNAYFYRNVAPDQQQAQGPWTEEEHEAFLATARRHGVGDQWGLFASYIPQRVGYQCSQYYCKVIIPGGFVLDPRFKMQRSGKAVFGK